MNRYVILLLLLIAVSCGKGPADDPDKQNHLHDEEVIQHTLFSGNTEFYIEHGSLETGHETEFLIHVTVLESYAPCSTGTVSVNIDGVSSHSQEPVKPGIFKVPLVPVRAGAFNLGVTLATGSVTESVSGHVHVMEGHHHDDDGHVHLVGDEGHDHDEGEHHHGQEGHDHDEGEHHHGEEGHDYENANVDHAHDKAPVGEITVLKELAWKSDFMVSRIDRIPFSRVIQTSGEIVPAPGRVKKVGANISGVVSFADQQLVQGSSVGTGQHLFTISGKELPGSSFELKLRQAANSLDKSRNAYDRHSKLYRQGAISQRQYQETRSEYIADSLQFSNLAATTTKDGLKVHAPITGTIHELNVSEGQYMETGTVLATISSDRVLLLRADLPQQHHHHAGEITNVNFRTAYSAEAYTMAEFNGRLLSTGRSVAENDHYLPVYFELENDGRLLEGAFAEVYLKTTPSEDRIIIPLSSLSEEQGSHYVYVQVTGESYSKRPVETGAGDGRFIEVTGGLQPGERIVTRGVTLVKVASLVTGVAGHGHSH